MTRFLGGNFGCTIPRSPHLSIRLRPTFCNQSQLRARRCLDHQLPRVSEMIYPPVDSKLKVKCCVRCLPPDTDETSFAAHLDAVLKDERKNVLDFYVLHGQRRYCIAPSIIDGLTLRRRRTSNNLSSFLRLARTMNAVLASSPKFTRSP